MPKLVTLFMDNRPGRLQKLAEVFRQENINIRTMTIQDRGESGIIKILVDKPDKAYLALADRGLACALKEFLAIEVEDKPGGFLGITEAFNKHGVNILDAYGFVVESSRRAVFCIEVREPEKIKALLDAEGVGFLEDDDLYQI